MTNTTTDARVQRELRRAGREATGERVAEQTGYVVRVNTWGKHPTETRWVQRYYKSGESRGYMLTRNFDRATLFGVDGGWVDLDVGLADAKLALRATCVRRVLKLGDSEALLQLVKVERVLTVLEGKPSQKPQPRGSHAFWLVPGNLAHPEGDMSRADNRCWRPYQVRDGALQTAHWLLSPLAQHMPADLRDCYSYQNGGFIICPAVPTAGEIDKAVAEAARHCPRLSLSYQGLAT